MNGFRKVGRAMAALAMVVGAGMSGAAAQTYPSKPIRLIVPFAPGGSVDLIARLLGQSLLESLGQPVVIDNRPGAGGAIGLEAAAKSPPDGYTLAITGSGAVTVSVHLAKLAYDPVKDFAPVAMVTTLPIVVAVHSSVPATSVRELIAYVKAHPTDVSFSTNGLGSISYLSAELFKRMTGIAMVHVPYKGGAPGSAALAAGEVQVGFLDSSAAMPYAQSGLLRPLAVTDGKRTSLMPQLPTVAESGVPGYEVSAWVGLFAPAGTPPPIVERINRATVQALTKPDVRERILKVQMEPAPTTPAELDGVVRAELDKWGTIIRETGMKPE